MSALNPSWMLEPHAHVGHVQAILFDVDDMRLFSAAVEGVLHVWNVTTGALLGSWRCHDGPIHALRRTSDGRRIFTSSHDGTIGIWDPSDGRLVRRLASHSGGVYGLAVSGSILASGGYDGTVRIWDTQSGAPIANLAAHTQAVTAVAFVSPDRLVSGSRDKTVRVWDLKRGVSLHCLRGHRHWVTHLGALSDGRRVLSAGEDGVCNLWDCELGEILWSRTLADGEPIWGFAIAARGDRAVTGGAGPTTCLDVDSGAARTIDLPPSVAFGRSRVRFAERSADISNDGRRVAGGSSDGGIVIYDLDQDTVVRTIPGASLGALSATVVGESGQIAIGCANGSIVLQRSDGRCVLENAHASMAYTLCSVGPRAFASGGFDHGVCIWDVTTRDLLARLSHGGYVFSVAASADGRQILSAGQDTMCLWDISSQRPIFRIDAIGSGMHSVADFTTVGGIASAGEDQFLRLWHIDGSLHARISLPTDQISAICTRPRSRQAVLADAGGGVYLVDLDTHRAKQLHSAHEDWIRGLQVTADGRYIASDSQNGICRIYDLEESRLLSISALQVPIFAAATAAHGEIVAVTAYGEIRRVHL
jgi:WD40 repeat protein